MSYNSEFLSSQSQTSSSSGNIISNKIPGKLNCKNEKTSNSSPQKYLFDFEQLNWNKQQSLSGMSKNTLIKIENERLNIMKDLQILKAIQKEKTKQEHLMDTLLQIKEELESTCKLK